MDGEMKGMALVKVEDKVLRIGGGEYRLFNNSSCSIYNLKSKTWDSNPA